jgi:hypothetical protein
METMQKILTWHPLGKVGVYVPKKDFEVISDFVLSTLEVEDITLLELIERGERALAHLVEENIAWHILVVKLDLEARGIIVSFFKLAPYKSRFLRLKKKGAKQFITHHDTPGSGREAFR